MDNTVTQKEVELLIGTMTHGKEFTIDHMMEECEVRDKSQRKHMRTILTRCCDKRLIKAVGYREGIYKVLRKITPVEWWLADESKYIDFKFPCSHLDDTTFGLNDMINVSPGDLIVIAGMSNMGKSGMVLNMLAENVGISDCLLMGNEYTNLDGTASPKFKRRMGSMEWVDWMNGDGKPKFDLLPVKEDYEDYIVGGKINFVDWINLTDNFYRVGKILEDIKTRIGDGVAVCVVQKSESKNKGIGGDFTEHMADTYLTLDFLSDNESRLTIGKVKDSKSRATGRMFAFTMVDNGANFVDIREIKLCTQCYGRKTWRGLPCSICSASGYMDLL